MAPRDRLDSTRLDSTRCAALGVAAARERACERVSVPACSLSIVVRSLARSQVVAPVSVGPPVSEQQDEDEWCESSGSEHSGALDHWSSGGRL